MQPYGTNASRPRSSGMKVQEENCNMVLLAVIALFGMVIASGATLVAPAETRPMQIADRELTRTTASNDKPLVYVSDQPNVRVVGSRFVPNTNPRER
jgi:hypothetical protein